MNRSSSSPGRVRWHHRFALGKWKELGYRTAVGESTSGGPAVVLYSRQGCCLCADALAELQEAQALEPFPFAVIDVDSDPELVARYGAEVPVVTIDGETAFRFRVDRRKLARRIRRGKGFWMRWFGQRVGACRGS